MEELNSITQPKTIENTELSEVLVKSYLEKNPHFFEQHPALLANIYLPSPHGDGAISLTERQQLAHRDKIRVLESKFSNLIQISTENQSISNKVHRLSVDLLASHQLTDLLQQLYPFLKNEFNIPHGALHIWAKAKSPEDATHPVFQSIDNTTLEWAESLTTAYCGNSIPDNIKSWLYEGHHQSFAVIPLKKDKIFGLLVLSSEDPKRFYPEMGTLFLQRIGELISAALLTYINV